jgi:hypothetical protein
MVNFLMRIFTKRRQPAPETPKHEKTVPAYYANIFQMITGLKRMLDNKHLTYPLSGLDNPVFEKDFQNLTPTERQEAGALIDDMIKEILFFQVRDPDSFTADKLAEMASSELLGLSARAFQDMPLYEMTIH